jgi:hypothetical protein
MENNRSVIQKGRTKEKRQAMKLTSSIIQQSK